MVARVQHVYTYYKNNELMYIFSCYYIHILSFEWRRGKRGTYNQFSLHCIPGTGARVPVVYNHWTYTKITIQFWNQQPRRQPEQWPWNHRIPSPDGREIPWGFWLRVPTIFKYFFPIFSFFQNFVTCRSRNMCTQGAGHGLEENNSLLHCYNCSFPLHFRALS